MLGTQIGPYLEGLHLYTPVGEKVAASGLLSAEHDTLLVLVRHFG